MMLQDDLLPINAVAFNVSKVHMYGFAVIRHSVLTETFTHRFLVSRNLQLANGNCLRQDRYRLHNESMSSSYQGPIVVQ